MKAVNLNKVVLGRLSLRKGYRVSDDLMTEEKGKRGRVFVASHGRSYAEYATTLYRGK
jgi:hypothetical protein